MIARSSLPSRPRTRLAALAVIALVTSLALAGCGSKAKSASDAPSASNPTEGGTELAALWPLTGLPASGATPKHPVMVVKVDNSQASYPQYGLGSADLVVEELVEGGYTRLAVAFYSKLPKVAGPVRSARASDIGIVRPTHAALIASGAAPPTTRRLARNGVHFYTEGATGTYRDYSEHDSLHSVFIRLPEFAKSLTRKPVVPPSYLPWGSESDFVGTDPAKRVTVRFSSHTESQFKYDGKNYVNTDGYTKQGDEFLADTLLVLRVKTGDAGYRDPAGSRVPETYFFGTGKAIIFHGGKAMRATWVKPKRSSVVTLTTATGEVKIPAGHVRIELLPTTEPGVALSFK